MRTYNHGATVRLVARFEHQGEPVDPPTVYVNVKAPGRDWEALEAGKSRLIHHDEPGLYYLELRTHDSDSPGTWEYTWIWTGIDYPNPLHAFAIRPPEEEIE